MIVFVVEFEKSRIEFPTLELANQYVLDNDIEAIPFQFEKIVEEIAPVVTVPDTISRMGLKIQLLLNGITIADIIDTINSIPSYMFPEQQKQIAIIKFQEAAYFDRYNADLQLIATLMGLTQETLDQIFINGNKV